MKDYTAGPWAVVQEPSGRMLDAPHPKFPEGRVFISSIYGASPENAQLMAAAPELYEALKAVVDCLSRPPNDGSYHTIDLTKARLALYKAKTGS